MIRRAALLALLLPAAAHAQSRPGPALPRAESSWSETEHAQTTVNRTFAFTRQDFGGRDVRMLLVQEIFATIRDDREGVEGRVRTTAYQRTGTGYSRALWVVDAAGDGAGMEDDVYWVQEPACCATEPTRRYYSLRTGRALFHATSTVERLGWDEGPDRRVAFVSANGAAQLPVFRATRDALGVLQLIVGEGVRQSLLLRHTDPVLDSESPEIGVILRPVRGPDGRSRPSNTVWVRFTDGREARIPVADTGFVLASAQMPPGVVASILP